MKNKKWLFMLSLSPLLFSTTQLAHADTTHHTSEVSASEAHEPVVETVTYHGKKIKMKKETKAVHDAKPVTSGNNMMGSLMPKSRVSCDVFTVGDSSRPRQDFVDVSSFQSGMTQKDFDTLRARGVKGIVVKLTEGTYYRNPYAKQEIDMAKRAGMQVSVYHFAQFQNKAQAEAEADYFARTAESLGLGRDTLMINDIESPTCNNGYATQNSVYFALRLIRTHHVGAVLHYGYQNWFDSGILNKNILGSDSIWEAGYPYSPSAHNLWYKGNAEAWQFTSTMRLPSGSDYHGMLDASVDYTGRFTKQNHHSEPKCTETDQYVSVTKKGEPIYRNFDFDKKQSSSNLYGQTLHAERYYTVDGKKYYSLYDRNNNWQGYASQDIIQVADDEGGIFWDIPNKYVKATKAYPCWATLGKADTVKGDAVVGKQYKAKGVYHHFNGEDYYSLYDKDDNWVGYTNVKALEDTTYFGEYHALDEYATLTGSGYHVFSDRNADGCYGMTGSYLPLNSTYHIKGYYDGFDGIRFYTVYKHVENGEDKWVGYVNANAFTRAVDDGTSQGGAWLNIPDKHVNAKKEWTIWGDFGYNQQRGTLKKGHQYIATGQYHHFNGLWYYSLYDAHGNWIGYANEDAF